MIDVSEGQTDQAVDRLQSILQDAEAGPEIQQRVAQFIVALGGVPQTASGSQG